MSSSTAQSPARYDLHMHTFWSYDASAEIRPYFERARELGVECIAITEHHNIDSFSEIAPIAEEFPDIRWIPSAELSVHTSLGSVDLLCYNLPSNPQGSFADILEEYNQWQRKAGEAVSEGFRAIGVQFGEEERRNILSQTRPERVLARQGITHLPGLKMKKRLFELGYCKTDEEYADLLIRRGKACPGPHYPDVERVVSAVKQAGGTVVIAHPQHAYFQGKDLRRMDQLREECSFDGIECAHRRVDPEFTDFYRAYCIQHGLVSTGGSDSHHAEHVLTPVTTWGRTTEARFGSHIGKPEWLDEFLERIG